MALLQQWMRQRPWLTAGLTGLVGGAVGLANAAMPWTWGARGTLSTHVLAYEHPMRRRIILTLEDSPGLCYRELQKALNAANGTLRHHLDVLQSQMTITAVSVNGRTCYFAGGPAQVEILGGVMVDSEEAAKRLPVGLSLVQRLIVEELKKGEAPKSQAALARSLGRTRATVHSAIKVLRRRGILRHDKLSLAPHLVEEKSAEKPDIEYEWEDERSR
ncbi:MAG: winged helix-turn-helix transcriptional regulator [Candidatus Poseidoniaceae archaeon]|nr:winged helix-turn-helix transcriptional regulator [Candidatus Poseidoniaceae archaeon]MDP7202507.1 winged helix-turn-helix transcriptional regulator [Candidatus Poseidoniaceae archaeon]